MSPGSVRRIWTVRDVAVMIGIISMIALVYVMDRVTGYFPDLTVLYLIPVVLATYRFGLWYGLAAAIVSLGAEVAAHPLIHRAVVVEDAVTHLAVFVFTAVAVDRLVSQLRTITRLESRRAFELDVARRVQGNLLEAPAQDEFFEVGHTVRFARELGGDFFHVALTPRGLFACVADISGKGIPAALFTAVLHEGVTHALRRSPNPASVVEEVNSRMFRTLPSEMFVTMFCALLSPTQLTFVNAGHEPGLLRSAATGRVEQLLTEGGMLVGIVGHLSLPEVTLPIEPGDALVCYTDGVAEAPAFHGHAEGIAGLVEELPQEDAVSLTADLSSIAFGKGSVPLRDDAAIVVIRRRLERPVENAAARAPAGSAAGR